MGRPQGDPICCIGKKSPRTVPRTLSVGIRLSAPDTDFTVKLIDEGPPNEDYPRGFAMNVTHGIQRCRYRNSREQAEWMEPGRVYKIEVVCYPTSNLFQTGHRIRVDIASSNYPHFDVNPNTAALLGRGQHTAVVDNTVHHSRALPSHVVLPVVL